MEYKSSSYGNKVNNENGNQRRVEKDHIMQKNTHRGQ